MSFSITVPSSSEEETILVSAGESVVFVGANGSGKTRLASFIENELELNAHRISAHRALSLNPAVPKISENKALVGLRTGRQDDSANIHVRSTGRWGGKNSVHLLNDFDYVIQALFAEQSNKSLETHKKARTGILDAVELTKFEVLTEIWERLLPHRKLHVSGDDILVSVVNGQDRYSASEMSDGERAVFYLLGQALVAAKDSLIIFDEPELHVHRSIMEKLWDEIESVRSDCAFVFITHDLDFASSRSAEKYVLRNYDPQPCWSLEKVPEDSGFDEELATLILGSRKPILFVEGGSESIDCAVYRACYPGWTVIPKGSCEEVIHSVVTMRNNASLTRISCSGIVDADDYSDEDQRHLHELGVAVLPVSEIENMILMPAVSRAIAESEGYSGTELDTKLAGLSEAVFNSIRGQADVEKVVVRYCRRRIDRTLKKIDFSDSESIESLSDEYKIRTVALCVNDLAKNMTGKINKCIAERDLSLLLSIYDNKGMLAIAASHLKGCRRESFKGWLVRSLNSNGIPEVLESLQQNLPTIEPK